MAVRLGYGGLQSYDPDQAAKSYFKKYDNSSGSSSSSGNSSGSSSSRAAAKAAAAAAAKAAQEAAAAEAARQAEAERKAAVSKAEQDRRAEQIAAQQNSSNSSSGMSAQQFQQYLREQGQVNGDANKYFQGYSYAKPKPEPSIWEKTKSWWEEQKKAGEKQLSERDKKILESREKYGGNIPFADIGGVKTEEEYKAGKEELAGRFDKVKEIADTNIKVSTVAINVPVVLKNGKYIEATPEQYVENKKEVKFIPYRDLYPNKNKISLSEFKELSRFATNVPIAEQTMILDKNIGNKYEKIYSDNVYNKYSKDLESGSITWDDAVKEYNNTRDYKTMIANYNKDYEAALKKTTTPATIFSRVSDTSLNLVPDTWGDFGLGAATLYGGGKLLGSRKAIGFVASKPITQLSQSLYDLAPQPTSFGGQLVKGSIAGALIGPTIGAAYATELGKGLISDPFETTAGLAEWGIEAPGEFLGFGLGGKARKVVKTQFGKILSGKQVKAKEITLKNGEKVRVIDVTAPTGEKVRILLQEGKYSASEKVSVQQELKILAESKGQKFFVHASPKPIPTTKFKSGDYGIDVTIERGLYLAPESALTMPGTTQAFTEYMEIGGRNRNIGTLQYLWEKIVKGKDLEISKGGRKALQIFQRKYPNLPKWMQEALLKKGSKLSSTSLSNINKWAKRFDVANKGKKFNVPGLGEVTANEFIRAVTKDSSLSGSKLNSAKAIYQWNIETQKGVVGGPEFITQPYGAEWQLIEPVGKQITKVTTPREKILRKFGIERGKEYTILGDDMIDISWFTDNKKVKPIKTSQKPVLSTGDMLTDFFAKREPKTIRNEKVKIREPPISFLDFSISPERRIEEPARRDIISSLIDRPSSEVRRPTQIFQRERRPTKRKRDIISSLIDRPRPIKPIPRPVESRPRPIKREIRPIGRVPEIDIFDRNFFGRNLPVKKTYTKKSKKKLTKKKKGYVSKITGFEAALGLGPRYVKAGKKFTGFESVRGVSARKLAKKKVKKKVVKKGTKKPKDNWGFF